MKKYQCLCCGYYTLEQEPGDTFEICPVCGWEDDGLQSADPDYEGGANHPSLNQARENYKKYGAVEECLIEYVRKPYPDETMD